MKKLLCALLVSACIGPLSGQGKAAVAEKSPATPVHESKISPSLDYILLPGDALSVQVFQEKDLDTVVRVSGDSTISLILIGEINVKGRTVRQIEEQVRQLYDHDYLVNPQVHIVVTEYTKRVVNVFGMVNKPGPIEFPQEKGLTLVEAIARADGFNRMAKSTAVTLTRTTADGKKETSTINVQELIDNKKATDQWPLMPDDIINVPEKFM